MVQRLLAIKSHPKYFLKYCCFTKDGNNIDDPRRKFPFEIEYHQRVCDIWFDNRLFIIGKSRQMTITWHMLAVHLWLGLTGANREIYFRRQTFEDAQKLLDDMEFIYDNIPDTVWPRDLLPEKHKKEGFLSFPEINTIFYAVSSGRDKLRGRTPTAVLLDEYAFQDDDEMVYSTIKPSLQGGARISIVSTPKALFAGDDPYFKKIMEDVC